MVNSPTSYLQTLAKEDAIAFVASLQSVKAHLHQELQWMEAQVQQKTVQLQGMETLLAEALALGLVTADALSIPENASVVETPSASIVVTTAPPHESALDLPAASTEPLATAIAALPSKTPSKQPSDQQGKATSTKASRGSKPSTASKSNASKAAAKPSASPKGKARQPGKASPLQSFLKSQWRDKALTESVANILNRAAAPLSTDEVMAALYDGLPKDDYNRAKHSLANILSVGRSKGTWKSTGRGRYAGNAGSNS